MGGKGTNESTLGGDNALTLCIKYLRYCLIWLNIFYEEVFVYVILLLKSMGRFQANIQALGVSIFETP